MPGRSGVTAPITPDSRTTGTTAVAAPQPRRQPAHAAVDQRPAIRRDHLIVPSCRYLELTIFYHATVIAVDWNASCIAFVAGCNDAAENDMKIYLLMMLIGTLLTAIHFTSAPEQRSKSLPQ